MAHVVYTRRGWRRIGPAAAPPHRHATRIRGADAPAGQGWQSAARSAACCRTFSEISNHIHYVHHLD
jgi:hypothetical protein